MRTDRTHHMLSPESRAAASEARRRRYAERPDVKAPQVFIVRLAVDHRFGWEIRRFGNIVLSRSVETYGSPTLARTAGERALANMAAETEAGTS